MNASVTILRTYDQIRFIHRPRKSGISANDLNLWRSRRRVF
jgi:hypothetical protein